MKLLEFFRQLYVKF